MGAVLIARGRDAARRLEPGRWWLESGVGLPLADRDQRGDWAVLHCDRRYGRGGHLVRSAQGWLVLTGTWLRPGFGSEERDVARLLADLEAHGPGVLEELDGLFAAAWWDGRADTLHVQGDPFGRLHIFVVEHDGLVAVGTSAVALAAMGAHQPDPQALGEYLATGMMYEDRSPFLGVRRLQDGARLSVGPAGISYHPRRPVSAAAAEAGGPAAPRDLARDLLEVWDPWMQAVRHQGSPALPDLTGGLDSRLTLGLMARHQPPDTVTVSGDSDEHDVRIAQRLADRLGIALIVKERAARQEVQSQWERVLDAARLSECGCEPIEYAAIASIHEPHAQRFGASINGSGGEMFREYWWGAGDLRGPRDPADAHAQGVRRMAAMALEAPFLLPEARCDLQHHFSGVMERLLAPLEDIPFHARMDHVYLYLRMQCWQGGMASAGNRIWPGVSPLMLYAPMARTFAADPAHRLSGRLFHACMAEFGPIYSHTPLDSGFPPQDLSASNAWRFLPGALRLPGVYGPKVIRRVRNKLGLPEPAPAAPDPRVMALMDQGAGDILGPRAGLRALVDGPAFDRWLQRARAGRVPAALLGRLLAFELAHRHAAEAAIAGRETTSA